MVFVDSAQEQSDEILFLDHYHPYRIGGEKNAKFRSTPFSGLILDLKERKVPAVLYFFRLVDQLIHPNISVCVVPSSDPQKIDTGIRVLGVRLAIGNRIDATGCLVRTKFVPKAALGGPRSVKTHLDSIEVRDPEKIRGAEVLLLDDVTTSGASLIACRQLLSEAGAKSVKCLALGQTTH
jgi:predicted amidophosphoribosyltransferase